MSEHKTDLPMDSVSWPEQLDARVVTPGPRPRVHGYDVEGDLALRYRFSDLVYLALTGELPEEVVGRAFEVCLLFLAPVSVAEAPVHAAVLAHHIGAPPSQVLATGCIGLAEQARVDIEELGDLLSWLDNARETMPPRYRADSREDQQAVVRFTEALAPTGFTCPVLEHDPGRLAALVGALHACGLRKRAQLEAVLVIARLPCLAAEGTAAENFALTDYPFDLPRFRYRRRDEP